MATWDSGHETPAPTRALGVAQRLREEILSGAFKPGAGLREVALSQRYGTSRHTLREALRVLADQGLVELLPRRGAVLPHLSPTRAREIYTLRALLEPFALRAGMIEGRIKDQERQSIEQAYARMKACAGKNDVAALIEADMAFHWTLCRPCGHQLLLDFLERLQAATRLSMVHMKVYGSDAEGEVESHAPILRAVWAHDPEGAAKTLHEHIIRNGERLLMKLPT